MNRKFFIALVAFMFLGVGIASAQDVFSVNYFSNNFPGAPSSTVRITNPGFTFGHLCAMIYVFDNDQQLTECCGCIETHDGLRTLSVFHDLTSNPLTSVVSNNGVIKIVSAAPNNFPCDPTSFVTPTRDLRAWETHIQPPPVPGVTDTEFLDVPLGATELANLQAQCNFIGILGSGQGTCSCGTGD